MFACKQNPNPLWNNLLLFPPHHRFSSMTSLICLKYSRIYSSHKALELDIPSKRRKFLLIPTEPVPSLPSLCIKATFLKMSQLYLILMTCPYPLIAWCVWFNLPCSSFSFSNTYDHLVFYSLFITLFILTLQGKIIFFNFFCSVLTFKCPEQWFRHLSEKWMIKKKTHLRMESRKSDAAGSGREVQEGGDIRIPLANSCWSTAETNTIL